MNYLPSMLLLMLHNPKMVCCSNLSFRENLRYFNYLSEDFGSSHARKRNSVRTIYSSTQNATMENIQIKIEDKLNTKRST